MKKQKLLTIAGFITSILLLYFALKDVKFDEIIETLKRAEIKIVFIPTLCIFISAILSAFKWSKISGNNIKIVTSFVALIIGLFVNNVLPARIGEIARAYVLSKKSGVSFTYAISTVLIDRSFDLIGLLLLTFLFFPKHSLPVQVSRAIYILVFLLMVCMVIMIIMSREKFIKAFTGKLTKIEKPFLLRLAKRIIEIQENLKRINSPLNILYFILIAFLQWLFMSASLFFVMLILGVHIQPLYIPFVCALLNMGLVIPSSPGYVGVYQFLLVYLLSIFGIAKHEGFAVSILFHASWYIPYNLLGFIFILKEHLNFKELKKIKETGS